MDHKKLIEAALFISQKPLDLHDLAKITGLSSLGFLKQSLDELRQAYAERGIEITQAGDAWQMQVRPELLQAVAHLTPHHDLAEGPKRSLALILYKEPITQAEVIRLQGTKAYAYVKLLRKRGLIRVEKRGHTSLLTATRELEEYFGMPKEKIREQLTAAAPAEPPAAETAETS